MARSAKPRSSRSTRKAVTIDLEAEPASAAKPESEKPVSGKSFSSSDTKKATEASNSDQTKNAAQTEPTKKEPPKPEKKPGGATSPPAPAKAASNSGMSSLTGGIIGGLLALIGGAGLQWAGVLPSVGQDPAAVEQVDLGPVQTEIDGLKAQINALQESPAATISDQAQASIDAAIDSSQDAVERASTLEQALQSLDGKIGEIEANISAGAAGENAGLETLAARVAEMESALASIADTGGQISPEMQSMIESLQTDLAAAQSGLASQSENMATLEGTISEQIASLDEKINGIAEQIESGASGANVAAAIASAGLKSAIDRGGSFMTELEAYASVAGDGETVDTLRNYAASGVATISQLSDQFPSVHNRIIAVGDGLDDNAGVADRLMASARSLVQVRTVGDVEGESPDQIAARIEARLKESDLASALAEWESLPDASKEASAEFAESLRARQTVDALVANALSGAMAAAASN